MSKKTFDYRVLSRNGELGVYEVYYNEDGEPRSSTTDPLLSFPLPTVAGLRYELEAVLRALDEPLLQYDDFKELRSDRDLDLHAAAAIDKIDIKL